MSLITAGRTLLITLLCLAGLVNLLWTAARRRSPVELRGCLFACAALFLFAASLWGQGARHYWLALTVALLGAISGLAWFCHIYKQSLHNTAM